MRGRGIITLVIAMKRIMKTLIVGMIAGSLGFAAGCGGVVASPKTILMSTKPHDGMVSSYRRLYPLHLPAGLKMYQIEYWSHHVQVEALLTEPLQAGQYPLLVNLHGGWVLGPHPHDNFGYTPTDAASLASEGLVELYPEYQGYGGSSGPTAGIRTDFINTQEAMKIAMEFGEVKVHDTYLWGYSLGGGLALMTAGWDHQVRAVVAVSPFVGLTDTVAFWRLHPKLGGPSGNPNEAQNFIRVFGSDAQGQAYRLRSPDPKAIQAPILLLQGTADQRVLWQTVQMFAGQMKKDHKPVTLILYPGGHHGLHHKYARASAAAIAHWFQRYGLNLGDVRF